MIKITKIYDLIVNNISVIFSLCIIIILDNSLSELLSVQRLSVALPSTDDILLNVQTILIILVIFTSLIKRISISKIFIVFSLILSTSKLAISVFLIIKQIIQSKPDNSQGVVGDLFHDALLLWLTNFIIFALWYWLLDRDNGDNNTSGQLRRPDFRFPLQDYQQDDWCKKLYRDWRPSFIDYLFLAFTTSTAVSPTDTIPLSIRAKLLMIIQSSISIIVLVIFVARAVNMIK